MVLSRTNTDGSLRFYTGQEIREAAFRFANGLRKALGVSAGCEQQTIVGLHLPHCVEFIWVDYGCAAFSFPNVFLLSTFSCQIIQHCILHCKFICIFQVGFYRTSVYACHLVSIQRRFVFWCRKASTKFWWKLWRRLVRMVR